MGIQHERLTGVDRPELQDFCFYEIVVPMMKPRLVLKMQKAFKSKLEKILLNNIKSHSSMVGGTEELNKDLDMTPY